MNRLKEQYTKEIVPHLMKKMSYKSTMQVPRLEKIVISVCTSDAVQNPKIVNGIVDEISEFEMYQFLALPALSLTSAYPRLSLSSPLVKASEDNC